MAIAPYGATFAACALGAEVIGQKRHHLALYRFTGAAGKQTRKMERS